MPTNVSIRPERAEDIAAISQVIEEAFRGHPHSSHTEQFIVAELRRCGALFLSLVAAWDSAAVGHIAFCSVKISDGAQGWGRCRWLRISKAKRW